MARPTPGVKNREWHKLLSRHGLELVRTTGGHAHYRTKDGIRITTVGPGRPVGPSFQEVKQVARALDLSIEELLAA